MTRPALLFDFGGTLDADGIPWSGQFHRAFAAEGVAVDETAFVAAFSASDEELVRWPGIRSAGYRAMVTRQCEIVGSLIGRPDRRLTKRAAARVVTAATSVVVRNQTILDGLQRHFRLGVVSNFTGNLDRCLAELELADRFEVVFDSGVVGVTKPAPDAFLWTLSRLGAEPALAWMIGDNFDADIRPAARLGLSTCWLAPLERPLPAAGIATGRITRLRDLDAVLTIRCKG